MLWIKAIEKIEQALAEGATVGVVYHKKWNRNCNEIKKDDVEGIIEYDWKGQICKAVNTTHDQINEGTHIIDEVLPDYYFGSTFN